MMLNTDMVLAFNLGDTPSQGQPNNCGGNQFCEPSFLRPIVDVFIDSNQAWLDAFFPAWQKMQVSQSGARALRCGVFRVGLGDGLVAASPVLRPPAIAGRGAVRWPVSRVWALWARPESPF